MKHLRILLSLGLLAVILLLIKGLQPGAVVAENQPESAPGVAVSLKYDPRPNPYRVEPPPGALDGTPRSADALAITVNYNPTASCPNVHPDDPNPDSPTWVRAAWPAGAQTAMNAAALIWSTLLNGSQTVVVDACWYATLDANTLGQARANLTYRDFKNAPVENTFYAVALANQHANSDLNGALPEINAEFNGNFSWYFGLDGRIPAGQTDFLTVALHEIGHGLGFSGSAQVDDGMGDDECNGTAGDGCVKDPPWIYDRFTYNGATSILDYGNPSTNLGLALTHNNWFFSGGNTNPANGNKPARLFAPATWDPGSSYSHLDETTFNNTPNALMTPQLAQQEALHHPGRVGLAILADIGWPVNNRDQVYVSQQGTGHETGTIVDPFNTVREGAAAVNNGGTVWIDSGSYLEPGGLTIARPMWLRAYDGTVYIGK